MRTERAEAFFPLRATTTAGDSRAMREQLGKCQGPLFTCKCPTDAEFCSLNPGSGARKSAMVGNLNIQGAVSRI